MRGRNPDGSAIETRASYHGSNRDPNTFGFAVWQLKDGEDQLIANRLVEIFSQTPKA
jgi:L-seryl-tRNA(Ser) seleniumtransferase